MARLVGDEKADDSGALLPEVLAALQAGDKIEAIRRLRESHGLGLEEAKEAVEALRLPQDTASLPEQESTPPASLKSLSLPPAALTALYAGDKIGAIRIVRETEGIGLKEAQDIVDSALQLQGGLRVAYEGGAPNIGGSRGILWLIALVAGVLVAWYVFRGR